VPSKRDSDTDNRESEGSSCRKYVYTYKCIYVNTYIYVYIYIYICVYIYIYIYIYMYIQILEQPNFDKNAVKSVKNKRKASNEGDKIEKENKKKISQGSLEKNVPEQMVPGVKNVPRGKRVFTYVCIDYVYLFINIYLLFIYFYISISIYEYKFLHMYMYICNIYIYVYIYICKSIHTYLYIGFSGQYGATRKNGTL
jgi:hypothetical protein